MALYLARREHHDHLVTLYFGVGLHFGDFVEILTDFVEQILPQLRVSHLAASKSERHFNLVAIGEKSLHIAHFDLIIVDVDVGAHLDFLDAERFLLFARLIGFFADAVFIFAIIEQFAHRRLGIRRDLDEIETGGFGEGEGFVNGDEAPIFAAIVNEPDALGGDGIIDARPSKLRRLCDGPIFAWYGFISRFFC